MKSFRPKPWLLPQPVLIIGTYDADGTPNAMNAAWGGECEMNEFIVSLGSHATTDNLDRIGEFSLTFATVDTLVASDYVGLVSGRKVHDKVARTGWKIEKGENVNAPVFTDFPLTFECRMKAKINASEGEGYYLVGEIINILCDEKYLAVDGKPDVEKMRLISFDPIHNGYIELGKRVGNAFHDGLALK
ncbi:MAG: flavin reductase [Muribaculaceae bacterium]|nr:flavin reductase [Muribaculaceae bacterium]